MVKKHKTTDSKHFKLINTQGTKRPACLNHSEFNRRLTTASRGPNCARFVLAVLSYNTSWLCELPKNDKTSPFCLAALHKFFGNEAFVMSQRALHWQLIEVSGRTPEWVFTQPPETTLCFFNRWEKKPHKASVLVGRQFWVFLWRFVLHFW